MNVTPVKTPLTGFQRAPGGYQNDEGFFLGISDRSPIRTNEYIDTKNKKGILYFVRASTDSNGKYFFDHFFVEKEWSDGTILTEEDINRFRKYVQELATYCGKMGRVRDNNNEVRDLDGTLSAQAAGDYAPKPPIEETSSGFQQTQGGWLSKDGYYFGSSERTGIRTWEYRDPNQKYLIVAVDFDRTIFVRGEEASFLYLYVPTWSNGSEITYNDWSRFKQHLSEINTGWGQNFYAA